jgi:hypothetical protein
MDFLYKICKKCEIEKELDQFYADKRNKDGREGSCKECKKKYQQDNKEIIKENKSKYYIENKDKFKEYKKNNKEKFNEYNRKYRIKNKDKIKTYKLTEDQKVKKKIATKKWLEKNKEYVKFQKSKYKSEKIKNDILFSLKHNINTAILYHLRKFGYSKKSRTHEILGCSFEEFKIYLELKFENWMTWENRGMYNGEFNYGWDIDHIIPISTAKTEEDIIRLNHYTNLQPLCSKINRDIKRDKSQKKKKV